MTNTGRMGAPPRKNMTRPPPSLSTSGKTSSVLFNFNGRVSPAVSVATNRAPTMRSPPHLAGTKRKEREPEEGSGEETNINVFVRCRGRNEQEVKENSVVAVSTEGIKGSSVELSMGPAAISHKTYHFDKVFSPAADQCMIFDEVVAPILDEVLCGFNCTIFAYGQTGTGKTYTMSGDISNTLPLSDSAGIVPRALHSLFDKLESSDAEGSVKCSFIELYNEELRDLLSADENVKLKIFEDANRKRSHATLIQGIEESHIKDAAKGVELLRLGSHKRQVGATKCNDLSSRSHTVFTITVYLKCKSNGEDDCVISGKLNLVDLAGSENIQRSGAENKRAAEAGLINKSLLTLGRVINALVDKSSHIPYRESKLTRLLQDSLGGRTKTCIIATLSPAKSNLEETISTLDYAFRAKNIRNKPQVNQILSKKTLIREFASEIEKLKGELIATRQRNGVYLTANAYEELMTESESRRILSDEQKDKIETMEMNLRNKIQELFSITTSFHNLKKDNETVKHVLDGTKTLLEKTEVVLAHTRKTLSEETMLRQAHEKTEDNLSSISQLLISALEQTTSDIEELHSKSRRESELQSLNRERWRASQAQVSHTTSTVDQHMKNFEAQQKTLLYGVAKRIQQFTNHELCVAEEQVTQLKNDAHLLDESENEVGAQTSQAREDDIAVLGEIHTLREELRQKVGDGLGGLSAAAQRISAGVIAELEEFHTQLHSSYSSLGKDLKTVFDDLLEQLNSTHAEANDLRERLSDAGTCLMQANEAASQNLEDFLMEERDQAAESRSRLVSEISSLILRMGDEQDARVESKIKRVRDDILCQNDQYKGKRDGYQYAVSQILGKEKLIVNGILASREVAKQKIKGDWMTANQQNVSIQSTARSIHQETTRIVESQMENMDVQLQALDAILSRVKTQNGRHHDAHIKALQDFTKIVKHSYSRASDQVTLTKCRVSSLQDEIGAETAQISVSLEPFAQEVSTSLANLRGDITGTHLSEYSATGQTPPKRQYTYPTCIPCTEPHDILLARLREPKLSPSKRRASANDLADLASHSDISALSPSKTRVFADVDAKPSVLRPINANGGTELKELDINVIPSEKQSVHSQSSQPPLKRQNTAWSSSSIKPNFSQAVTRNPGCKDVVLSASIGPGGFVIDTKFARTKLLAEGRENIPLSASVGPGGVGRVLRTRSRS